MLFGMLVKTNNLNIPQLISDQREFFKSQKTKSISFRKNALKKLKHEIQQKENEIYNALKKDFNKPEFETYLSEIGIVYSEIDLAIKNISKWSKPKRVSASLLNFPSSDYIYSEPYGTVLIIAPWNYPFQLAIAPLIAAITGGNTAVLKPSELTPNTSKLISEIVTSTFSKNHVCVVEGGIPLATMLLEQRWDYIFFTGSVPVGKIVAKAAAKYMTPVTLELGGKSPCIIDDSVNVKLVAKRLVWGKFLNAGQTCIAPDYLIVKDSIKQKLISNIEKEVLVSYGKNPEESQDFARIVNSKNLERLSKMLDDSNVIFGGQINKDTNYLSPTLIDEPTLDSNVMREEIFGPILPILSYSNENDIDAIITHFEKPLSLYIFSKRSSFTNYIVNTYSFGGGVINDTLIHFGNHNLPFGGVGESGLGAYHGRLGFETFSHNKAVVKKANWLDVPLRYAPYNGKLKLLKILFKWLS